MAGVERVSVHVSRLAHCPDVFFVEYFDVSLDYLTGRSDYTKPLEVA